MVEQLVAPRTARTAHRGVRITAKALPQHTRTNNRSLVLQMLFDAETMSRADIARASGLTRATVSALVGELVDEGMVAERGTTPGTRVGKPGILVGLNADAFHILALDLSADDRFIGAVINLRGELSYRTEVPIAGATGDEAFELVVQLVAATRKATARPVLGVGIGSPGIVAHGGTVLEASHLGWTDFGLAQRLEDRIGLPVHVGNDANAAALGVRTFRETGDADLIVVNLTQGAGAGLIVGGALLEGEQFAAGEIGHVTVDENGERCVCGRRGCLDLYVAALNARRRLAEAGDDARHSVLAEAGQALGIVLAPVISVLNLTRVVLRGPRDVVCEPLLEAACATIRGRTMAAVSSALDMSIAAEGEDLVLLGAAVFVLSARIGVS